MFGVSLTRRGRLVAGICLVASVAAVTAGGRSLNAVVVPGLVALAAGFVQLRGIDAPGVRRTGLTNGFVGEERTVATEFTGDPPGTDIGRPFLASVRDRLTDGLVALGGDGDLRGGDTADVDATTGTTGEATTQTTVGDAPARYRIRYDERGVHRVGPAQITATDVFGLYYRRFLLTGRDTVTVYPSVRTVPGWFRRRLSGGEGLDASQQREAFDRLREYARGDALRDVHWPTTAKRNELIVKSFAAETDRRRVSIAGETQPAADDDTADALASAIASVGLALLNDGVGVDVRLPHGDITADPGPRGRRTLLKAAARVDAGSLEGRPTADVRLVAADGDVQIQTPAHTLAFSALVDDALDPEADSGVRAVQAGSTGVAPTARGSTDQESQPTTTGSGGTPW